MRLTAIASCVVVLLSFACVPACGSSDSDTPPSGTGGTGAGGQEAGVGGTAGLAGQGGTAGASGLGGGGTAGTTPDSGPEADSSTDAPTDAPVYNCPTAIPSGACVEADFPHSCWYGADTRWFCKTAAFCDKGNWETDPPLPGCDSEPAALCPTDPTQPGTVCDTDAGDGLQCVYGTKYCVCGFGGGPASVWKCSQEVPTGCPAIPPDESDPCEGTTSCIYDTGCGSEATCVSGKWHWEQLEC